MSFEALRIAVTDRFNSNWTQTPLTKVDYGSNHKFDPPNDGSPWARLTTVVTNTENAQVGTDFQRATGFIIVQCFVEIDTGEKVINEMVDAVAGVFQNKNFGGVECFVTSPIKIGEQKTWFQVNAQTPFVFDIFS